MKIFVLFILLIAGRNSTFNFGDESPFFGQGNNENMDDVNDYIASLGNSIFSEMEVKAKGLADQLAMKQLRPGFLKEIKTTNSIFGKSDDSILTEKFKKIEIDGGVAEKGLKSIGKELKDEANVTGLKTQAILKNDKPIRAV